MTDHFKTLADLDKVDAEFLLCISKASAIDLRDLHKILSIGSCYYVEYPMDDFDDPDINVGYDEKYEWCYDRPIRINGYGREIDYEMAEIDDLISIEVKDRRLVSLMIDLTDNRIKDKEGFLKAVNGALQKFGDDLVLETLCFGGLFGNRSVPELCIKLPYLKTLIINMVEFKKIKFISAPRLECIKIIDSGESVYDLSRMLSLKLVCIGDHNVIKIILPVANSVEKIIIGKGCVPTVRERNNGIGGSLVDLVLNVGFSVEYIVLAGCGISKIDLSECSNLKYLNLSNNPINKLNLAWVPGLEYLNLQGTGIHNVDRRGLSKLKHVLVDTREPEPK
jgi:hypothetical protein